MAAVNLTFKRLHELLHYCSDTGVFTWVKRPSNRIKIGQVAGCINVDGYVTIRIDSEIEYGHRLAWLYSFKKWPADQVDHINGSRADNRIANLREADQRINSQNQRRARRDNKSTGLLGVTKRGNKWRAQIMCAGAANRLIGSFASPDEAHAAYLAAKRLIHPGGTL